MSDISKIALNGVTYELKDSTAREDLYNPAFEDYTGSATVPSAATALAAMKTKTKIGTLLSNIKAFCKGCCTLAMIVNNCVTNNPNLPLSAAQGKALMDLIIQQSSDFAKTVYTFTGNDSYVTTQYCQIVGYGKVITAYLYITTTILNTTGEKILGYIKNNGVAINLSYDYINTITFQDGTVANLKIYKDGKVVIYNMPNTISAVPLLYTISLVSA